MVSLSFIAQQFRICAKLNNQEFQTYNSFIDCRNVNSYVSPTVPINAIMSFGCTERWKLLYYLKGLTILSYSAVYSKECFQYPAIYSNHQTSISSGTQPCITIIDSIWQKSK